VALAIVSFEKPIFTPFLPKVVDIMVFNLTNSALIPFKAALPVAAKA
jgi:hypothetical protein